jgi:hypothetical protein
MANKLRSKHKRFLKDIITISMSTIKNIHKVINITPHVSLMQVLMSWHSDGFADRNLFISLDEYRDNINFTYHKDAQEKASNIIPLLSLILEDKYRPRAWKWSHDEARNYTTSFHYDHVTEKFNLGKNRTWKTKSLTGNTILKKTVLFQTPPTLKNLSSNFRRYHS